jgi:hypothetical protein
MGGISQEAMDEAIQLVRGLQEQQSDDALRVASQHAARQPHTETEEIAQRCLGLGDAAVDTLRKEYGLGENEEAIRTFLSWLRTDALHIARQTDARIPSAISLEEVGAYYGLIVCLLAKRLQDAKSL